MFEGLATQGPAKLFYYGPMFRYERPQKGRYRQFWQIGAEAIGYRARAWMRNCCHCWDSYFRGFGLSDVELKLNSLGCNDCRPAYRQALVGYLERNESALCEDCKRRLQTKPAAGAGLQERGLRASHRKGALPR